MRRIIFFCLEGIVITGMLIGCSKKDAQPISPVRPPDPAKAPAINAVSITNFCNRSIKILGLNFNNDISKDSVFFGNSKGIIDSVSQTQIIATYPAGNVSGKITLYINGVSAISPDTVNIALPIISSFSPALAGPGTLDTITGQNFNPDVQSDSVYFGTTKAEIVSATTTQIIVRIPQNAQSSLIKVYNNCQSASTNKSFTFSNKGTVFASSNAGICYAIDISSGNTIWTAATNSGFFCGPTYDKGVVYIGSSDVNILSNNYLYALNAQNGKEIWKYNAGPYDGIPTVSNGVLYAAGFDKQLLALNAATGQKLWNFTGGDYFRAGSVLYFNSKVYMRNDDGYFYCVDAATGNMIWKKMIWPVATASTDTKTIFIAASDGLYALNPDDGSQKWYLPSSFTGDEGAAVSNGIIYIASSDHRIYAVNASNGKVIWNIEASWWVASSVFIANNILYVHSGDGVIGAVDATNGTILWAKQLGFTSSGYLGESPVVANGIIFVGDDFGTLNALNATTGDIVWTKNLGGYPMLSSPCIVDSVGNVYHGNDSGNK